MAHRMLYQALCKVGDRVVYPALPAFAKPAWNHPAGPKTVFFWAPTIKWCLIGAGLADLARPADKLSASQNTALAGTGFIWTRYCLVITPINYYLSSVNFFVGCIGLTQLIRVAYYRRMEENGSCDLTCIASIVVVGLMWGATNPFLRMASASTSNADKNRDAKQSATSVCSRVASFIGSFILLLLDWRFSLPFALNQLASIVFQILVVYLPVSLVVPCVNAIQVASSAATSQLLGESRPSMQTAVGCLLVTFGVFIMMSCKTCDDKTRALTIIPKHLTWPLHPQICLLPANQAREQPNASSSEREQSIQQSLSQLSQQQHSGGTSASASLSNSAYESKTGIMRFRQAVINYVENNTLKYFFPNDIDRSTDVLGVLATVLLHNMEDPERDVIVEALVSLVTDYKDPSDPMQKTKRSTYEKVIDEILRYAYSEGALGLNRTVHGLILTSDFSLYTPLNLEKWRFIEECIPKLDYKGIQILIRTILINQFKDVPLVLSSEQMRQLTPIENMLLRLLDRENNALPAIFSMTEASRGSIVRSANIFPRLTATLSHLNAMFRPIADLTYVVGRPFMFPLPGHPAFLAAAPAWKMESDCNKISHKPAYLPYRPELKQPQVYTLYMLLKQPRGKEYLSNIIRQVSPHSLHTSPWEPLLSVFVCDVMCEAERLPENAEIPRYQWENLLSIFLHFVQIQHITISHIFKVLSSILEKTTYRRARDEVMWLALQLIGSFPALLNKETITEAARLYNVLFNEEVVWTGASDHPLKLTRFLAAACMWNILDGTDGLPQASSSLQVQVDFIRSKVDTADSEQALLAVLANAYRSDSNVYKNVKQAFAFWLIGPPNEELHFISYNRTVINKFAPIQTQYLDSLTMRAKNHVYIVCTSALQKSSFQLSRLPSPALIDTMARLVQTMEFDFSAKSFITLVVRTLQGAVCHQPLEGARESCYIFYEILCYRIPNIAIPVHARLYHIIMQTITAMITLPYTMPVEYMQQNIPPGSQSFSTCSLSAFHLYSVFEQTLIRQWAWTSHADLLYCAISFFHRQCATGIISLHFYFPPGKQLKPELMPYGPEEFKRASHIGLLLINPNYYSQTQEQQNNVVPPSAEISRMFFISLLRAMKIMGVETTPDCELFTAINQAYKWPASQFLSFPPEVYKLAQPESEEKIRDDEMKIKETVNRDFLAWQGMHTPTFMDYMLEPLKQGRSPLTIFCIVHQVLCEDIRRGSDIRNVVYSILEMYQPKHIQMATNALVEYVIALMNTSTNKTEEDLIIRVLMQLVFEWQLLPFDRLLNSLVLHPVTDRQSQLALAIVSAFCSDQCEPLTNRLNFYLQNVPPRRDNNQGEFFRRLAEYHHNFPELTYSEMRRRIEEPNLIDSNVHMPIYYGSLVERLLPIIDYTLARALELGTNDAFFVPIMSTFSKLYRYHPSPIQFVYTILFTLHEHIGNQERARNLTMHILAPSKSWSEESLLTQSFIAYNHQRSSHEQVIADLVDRLIQSSEFLTAPPAFCAQDWRFAEFPPATQTLYLACIELMASPYKPEIMVPAMINYLYGRRHKRPYSVLNAMALILTALPAIYGKVLQEEFLAAIDSEQLEDLRFEDIVLDNFEENMLLNMPNRAMIISVMLQAFWQHSHMVSISKYAGEYVTEIFKKVTTENGLWYVLRLAMPLLQRCQDTRDRHKQIFDIFNVARQLMNKLAELSEAGVEFVHQNEICDLLYHLKYTFIGDFLRRDAEASFSRLNPKMRERLKFFTSLQSSSSSSTAGSKHHDEDIVSKLSTSVRPEGVLSASVSAVGGVSSSSHLGSLSRTASDAGTVGMQSMQGMGMSSSNSSLMDMQLQSQTITSAQQHQALSSRNSGFINESMNGECVEPIAGCSNDLSNSDVKQCPWYWGDIKWKDAERLLLLCSNGTFLLRDSHSDRFLFTVSYKINEKVYHSRIRLNDGFVNVKGTNCAVRLLEQEIEKSRSGERHMLMHKRGAEAEASEVQLTQPLSRLQLLPSLQYLCRLHIRLHFHPVKQMPAALQRLSPKLRTYVSDSKFIIPDLNYCYEILKSHSFPSAMTTIFALSSGALPSAIAVFRVSGNRSLPILQQITRRAKWEPRRLQFVEIIDNRPAAAIAGNRQTSSLIDRAMAVYLPGPATFTGEDTAEIYIHGSRAVASALADRLSAIEDVRHAKRGEFSKRAFFNGKMDLHEVQGLQNLINAETQRQRIVAYSQMRGGHKAVQIRDELADLIGRTFVLMDFGEHVESRIEDVRKDIHPLVVKTEQLLQLARGAEIVHRGLRVVLCGRPNSGKSSLLNALANRSIAIVSELAGTTRDIVETRLEVAGIPVAFTDTAGIWQCDNVVEKEGIRRAKQKLTEADLILLVVEPEMSFAQLDELVDEIQENANEAAPWVLVQNKADLMNDRCNEIAAFEHRRIRNRVQTCALTSEGVGELSRTLESWIGELCPNEQQECLADHALLSCALDELVLAAEATDPAIMCDHLQAAMEAYAEMVGGRVTEQILDNIFSKLCIGK
ncbi:hypothetical protein WR25_20143 [Diploscapter pachys]|uniref:Mediator of RNA polymerase II transcription subunit 23 n=1 Tax=Diploscapter pachys TaxID=2018661 RepID=A0A2A2J872_9BILA|nr:hypothetical protein WR25_20143 [Diploscapter pachys]